MLNLDIETMLTNMKVYCRNMSVDSDSDMSGDECTEQFDDLLYQASKDNRLTRGVFQCAHVLETCPDIVSLCLLPSAQSESISIHIQHKLIEAYCWENEIEVIKVDNATFSNLSKVPRSKAQDQAELGCVLVTSEPVMENLEEEYDCDEEERFG